MMRSLVTLTLWVPVLAAIAGPPVCEETEPLHVPVELELAYWDGADGTWS